MCTAQHVVKRNYAKIRIHIGMKRLVMKYSKPLSDALSGIVIMMDGIMLGNVKGVWLGRSSVSYSDSVNQSVSTVGK